jgi:MYND finger
MRFDAKSSKWREQEAKRKEAEKDAGRDQKRESSAATGNKDDGKSTGKVKVDLGAMSVAELKRYISSRGGSLAGCVEKADLLAVAADLVSVTPSSGQTGEHAQPSPRRELEIGLALVEGGETYIQYAWWPGATTPPGQRGRHLVEKFARAFVERVDDSVISREVRDCLAPLFEPECPVWQLQPLTPARERVMIPATVFLSNACRIQITAEKCSVIREAAACAAQMNDLPPAAMSDPRTLAATLRPLAGLLERGTDRGELRMLFQVLLNLPKKCYGLVYSIADDAVEVVRANLDMDVANLDRAVRCMVPTSHETRYLRKASRLVCFWCGSSPLGRDVSLHECPRCRYVAYCSRDCRDYDWAGEHHRECGKTAVSHDHPLGIEVLPMDRLGVSRMVTETSLKAQTPSIPLPTGNGIPFALSRGGLTPEGAVGVLSGVSVYWMGWGVENLT